MGHANGLPPYAQADGNAPPEYAQPFSPVASHPVYSSPAVRSSDHSNQMAVSLAIFLMGFIFPVVWIGGVAFWSSPSPQARMLGKLSVFCCGINTCLIICTVGLSFYLFFMPVIFSILYSMDHPMNHSMDHLMNFTHHE